MLLDFAWSDRNTQAPFTLHLQSTLPATCTRGIESVQGPCTGLFPRWHNSGNMRDEIAVGLPFAVVSSTI